MIFEPAVRLSRRDCGGLRFRTALRMRGHAAGRSTPISGPIWRRQDSYPMSQEQTFGEARQRCTTAVDDKLFCLDAGGLDNRPPLLSLGSVESAERFRCQLIVREKLKSEIDKTPPDVWIGQGRHGGGIDRGDKVLRRAL